MLRDRLVRGVNDSHIQRHLPLEPVLTLKSAMKIELGMESVAQNALAPLDRFCRYSSRVGWAISSSSSLGTTLSVKMINIYTTNHTTVTELPRRLLNIKRPHCLIR